MLPLTCSVTTWYQQHIFTGVKMRVIITERIEIWTGCKNSREKFDGIFDGINLLIQKYLDNNQRVIYRVQISASRQIISRAYCKRWPFLFWVSLFPCVILCVIASKIFAASRSIPRSCRYISVVFKLLCPRISWARYRSFKWVAT